MSTECSPTLHQQYRHGVLLPPFLPHQASPAEILQRSRLSQNPPEATDFLPARLVLAATHAARPARMC